MKWRVVGWTYYDDHIEEGETSWAAHYAIVDEVKSRGYLFSGFAHQEGYDCAPVLNDGKIRRYTQRGWGGVMAEAYGYTGTMDYAKFAFMTDPDSEIRPQETFDGESFTPETDLNERFELTVSESVLNDANRGEIKLDDLPELRYLDVGDTLALRVGDEVCEYAVLSVDRDKDLTEEQKLELQLAMYDYANKVRKQRAQKEYENTKDVIIVKLQKATK